LNRKGSAYLKQALASTPRHESVEDLEYLRTLREIYQPLMDSLELYHTALYSKLSGKPAESQRSAQMLAERARDMAAKAFPNPIDPVGGEVGALRKLSAQLVESIRDFESKR
jgi:hypothetical protein